LALAFVALPESVALFGIWALLSGALAVLGVSILAVAGVTGISVPPLDYDVVAGLANQGMNQSKRQS
jgi:hypothetical protein